MEILERSLPGEGDHYLALSHWLRWEGKKLGCCSAWGPRWLEEHWALFVNVEKICYEQLFCLYVIALCKPDRPRTCVGGNLFWQLKCRREAKSLKLFSETPHVNLNLSWVIPANILISGKGNPRSSSFCERLIPHVAQWQRRMEVSLGKNPFVPAGMTRPKARSTPQIVRLGGDGPPDVLMAKGTALLLWVSENEPWDALQEEKKTDKRWGSLWENNKDALVLILTVCASPSRHLTDHQIICNSACDRVASGHIVPQYLYYISLYIYIYKSQTWHFQH